MATDSQILANRENSQASTGPRTQEGKTRTARNAVTLGLFTMNDFVLPEETAEHAMFCQSFWKELRPAGPVEETFATEMIRAAWRLRRCGLIEARLVETLEQNEANLRAQTAVDRARAQANNIFRRAHNDLRRLQSERPHRANGFEFSNPPVPAPTASFPPSTPAKQATEKQAAAKQTQFIPVESKPQPSGLIAASRPSQPNIARRAPCPCHSGEKYKRCCGRNAPPMLHQAA